MIVSALKHASNQHGSPRTNAQRSDNRRNRGRGRIYFGHSQSLRPDHPEKVGQVRTERKPAPKLILGITGNSSQKSDFTSLLAAQNFRSSDSFRKSWVGANLGLCAPKPLEELLALRERLYLRNEGAAGKTAISARRPMQVSTSHFPAQGRIHAGRYDTSQVECSSARQGRDSS